MIPATRLAAAAGLPAPLVVVDLESFDANAAELLRRADGRPVRLATKSVRVPALVERALAAGFDGLMAYSLREALWWAARGVDDVLVGYPTVDAGALAALVADDAARAAVTLMVDDVAHLDLLADARSGAGAGAGAAAGAGAGAGAGAAAGAGAGAGAGAVTGADAPVRVCIDVDASLRPGPARLGARRPHLGVRRSPLREPAEVAALAREATLRGLEVRGVMFYEAQVAGLPDASAAVRAVKRASLAELATRRDAVVAAVRDAVGRPVTLVNGGGTGSLARTAADPVVTELTAGSGLAAPTLFDHYRVPPGGRALRPAVLIGLDVVRRPAPGVATVFSGGYLASGPPGADRLPLPVLPPGLHLTRTEGAGEVQTPVRGRAADRLAVGDRVWFRHAKAGEVMERFSHVALLHADGRAPDVVPTYRGAGLAFG